MGKALPIPSTLLKGRTVTEIELQTQKMRHEHRRTVKERYIPNDPASGPAPSPQGSKTLQEETLEGRPYTEPASPQTLARKPSLLIPGHFPPAPTDSNSGPLPSVSDALEDLPVPAPVTVPTDPGNRLPADQTDPVLDGPTYKHKGWTCHGCLVR